jgi:hypothetical protein
LFHSKRARSTSTPRKITNLSGRDAFPTRPTYYGRRGGIRIVGRFGKASLPGRKSLIEARPHEVAVVSFEEGSIRHRHLRGITNLSGRDAFPTRPTYCSRRRGIRNSRTLRKSVPTWKGSRSSKRGPRKWRLFHSKRAPSTSTPRKITDLSGRDAFPTRPTYCGRRRGIRNSRTLWKSVPTWKASLPGKGKFG